MNDDDWVKIAQNIRIQLAIHHMTRRELATELGWGPAKLRRRMYGENDWTLQDLGKVARVFDTTIDKLVEWRQA